VIRKFIFRLVKVFLLLTALLALAAALAWAYPEKFLCVDSGKVSGEVIVVLGGGIHERPVRAAELFKQHAAPRIILTGAGDDEINRTILLQAGVPASAIQLESNSATTCENAKFTIKLLREQKVQRVILVTSWYHARRAQKTFEHYAPEIQFYSRPSYFAFDREEWKPKGNSKRIQMEFVKLPGYWLRHGVCPF
jgi:uncharacterized SAM-binding protein YcdF (DUF218 family)